MLFYKSWAFLSGIHFKFILTRLSFIHTNNNMNAYTGPSWGGPNSGSGYFEAEAGSGDQMKQDIKCCVRPSYAKLCHNLFKGGG